MIKRIKSVFYSSITISIVICSTFYLQSCEQDFVEPPVSSAEQFPDDISAIFNTAYGSANITCNSPSCHSSASNASGLDLTDWTKTLNGSDNGTMVIPYNGFWSHMISVINSDTNYAPVTVVTIFPEYHKIDSAKVRTVMNWINGGAKSKSGTVAFTNVQNNVKGFITNQAADLVAVLNTSTNQVMRLIPVGGRADILDSPHYVTISPDKQYYYVSLIQEGYVEKYNVSTYAQVGRMPAGASPAHIEITPDGLIGFVTNFESTGTVTTTTKFNAQSMNVINVFSEPRMKGPHGMALSADGSILYVTSEIGEYIFKISTQNFYASDTTYIKSPIDPSVPPTGNGTGNFRPYQIELSPDGTLLYISCRGSNQVRIYRASDLQQVNAIDLGSNAFPLLMKFTNDGHYLYVCNRNNNTVSVINGDNQTLVTTITGVGIQPHGVDFTPDGQYAIIACETQSGFDGHHPQISSKKIGVSRIIKTSNNTLLNTRLEMGSFPAGIAIIK